MSELSASILLTLRDEVSQRTKAIAARINELEAEIKQGGDVGAAAAIELREQFDLLSKSTRESEQIARKFAQAQKVIGTTTDRTAAATNTVANAQRQAGSAIRFVSKESKNQGREVGGLVNVFAELGYSVGAAVPGMQQVGTQLAIMGGSAYQLGAAFGVAGAAVGVLSGLLPTLISSLAGVSREARNLKQDIDETNESYDSLIGQIRRRMNAEERAQAIERGEADVAEQRAELEARRRTEREGRAPLNRTILEATNRQATLGSTLRNALYTAFTQQPGATADEASSSSFVTDAIDQVARERSERAGREGDQGFLARQREQLRAEVGSAAENVEGFTDHTGTSLRTRVRAFESLRERTAVAERGLAIAEERAREQQRREAESESVDLRLRGANSERGAAQRGLLELADDAHLGRRRAQRVQHAIRDGSLSERDARRIGGEEGLRYLESLRAATERQEQLQAERERLEAESRARRLAELDATTRAAGAMERAAEAMERATSSSATPARGRAAFGQGAELGGAT